MEITFPFGEASLHSWYSCWRTLASFPGNIQLPQSSAQKPLAKVFCKCSSDLSTLFWDIFCTCWFRIGGLICGNTCLAMSFTVAVTHAIFIAALQDCPSLKEEDNISFKIPYFVWLSILWGFRCYQKGWIGMFYIAHLTQGRFISSYPGNRTISILSCVLVTDCVTECITVCYKAKTLCFERCQMEK